MIVETVFPLIMNQTKIRWLIIKQKTCHLRNQIPVNLKRNQNLILLCALIRKHIKNASRKKISKIPSPQTFDRIIYVSIILNNLEQVFSRYRNRFQFPLSRNRKWNRNTDNCWAGIEKLLL